MRTLSELVKGDTVSCFDFYREGFLYYTATYIPPDTNPMDSLEGYRFPIPIEDTKGATFTSSIKSITLMRWIRKAIEDNTLVKV